MKKRIMTVLLTLCLCLLPYRNIGFHAETISNSGDSSVKVGSSVTIIFIVSNVYATSGSIEITCSESLEVVSGKFGLADTLMTNFDLEKNKGAFAFAVEEKLAGTYFSVTLQGKSIDAEGWVKAAIICSNGETEVLNTSSTKKIKVICKKHSYGDWKYRDATCTKEGYRLHTCKVCGTEEKIAVVPLGHDTTDFTVTVEPTCLSEGQEVGKCSRCNNNIIQTVAAKGHDYGSWIKSKISTCTTNGEEYRSCKVCGEKETQTLELAKHSVSSDAVVVTEATLTTYGIVEGICVVCGEKVRSETSCVSKDETTGIEIKCEQGVFEEGTKIEIKKIEEESTSYQNANIVLKDVCSKFVAFDISALLNGISVQPNGTLEVTFDLPEGFSEKSCVVFVGDDSSLEIESTKVNNGKVSAEITHFSTYAIVDLQVSTEQTEQVDSIWIYTSIGFGFTTALLIVILIYARKDYYEK